jgi:hypothetical protein
VRERPRLELHAVATPMLQTAQEIQAVAPAILETGRDATRAAEEARDALLATNELIERTLRLAGPLERAQQRIGSRLGRSKGGEPPDPPDGAD